MTTYEDKWCPLCGGELYFYSTKIEGKLKNVCRCSECQYFYLEDIEE